MEGQGQMVAPHGHAHAPVHEDDPHRTGRAAIEGEEKRHDDKPAVLKKMKEKVKKIKEKIGKKKRDDGRDHSTTDSEEEEELEEEGYKEDDEEPDQAVHAAPPPKRETVVRPGTGKISLGESTGPLEEDPAAPYSRNPAPRGEEIGMSPVIKAFESMDVSEQPKAPKTESESNQTVSTGSTDQHDKTYTEKLKSIATVPAEYGMQMASTIYNKISNMMPENPMRKEKVETSGEVNQDKGVSVKEYLSEKLMPGEEDKASSEAITDSTQRRKEEMGQKAGDDVTAVGGQVRDGGVRVVERIREAVTSVLSGGEQSDVNHFEGTGAVEVSREEPEHGVIEVSRVEPPKSRKQ